MMKERSSRNIRSSPVSYFGNWRGFDEEARMSRKSLQKQADRADDIADQTVDEEVKANLHNAAKEYRAKAAGDDRPPKPVKGLTG
jgi:hypothetical protein